MSCSVLKAAVLNYLLGNLLQELRVRALFTWLCTGRLYLIAETIDDRHA